MRAARGRPAARRRSRSGGLVSTLSNQRGIEGWIDLNGPLIVRDGAVAVALGVVGVAAIVEGVRVAWVEPDRLIEVGDGAVAVVLGVVGVPAIVEGIRV